jgi:uncharacterized membrane protein YadS
MSPAAFSSKTRKSKTAKRLHGLSAWHIVPALSVVLVMFLAFVPDGVAESLQALASWLLIAGVAALAVAAIVKGLERLLDCEAD